MLEVTRRRVIVLGVLLVAAVLAVAGAIGAAIGKAGDI